MRIQRHDRHRSPSGPLSAEEVEALFERGYSLSARRFIASVLGLDPEGVDAADVIKRLHDAEKMAQKLEVLSALQSIPLTQVAASGGRLRGESLRRDLLLRGFGNTETVLRELVEQGLLIPLPSPGQTEFDIEQVLEQSSILQHDLAVCAPIHERLYDKAQEIGPSSLRVWNEGVEETHVTSTDTLELNLLHLNALLSQERLRLNKSGVPNRRSLMNFARGIVMPTMLSEASEQIDLKDPSQVDYLSFLLALSVELGFATAENQTVSANYDSLEDFFCAEQSQRDRMLVKAFQNIKLWSELQSFSLVQGLESASQTEQFSQLSPGGESLIGARGYVLSVLKRARIQGWTSLDALIELGVALDSSYLERALKNAAPLAQPRPYVEAVVTRALVWMGFVALGAASDSQHTEVARFTPRGAQALNLAIQQDDEGLAPSEVAQPYMIVQPNFEIMTFLDGAPLEALYRLYQFGERSKLSDRVATFILSAESVQRGFTVGTHADEVIEQLQRGSHTPVPESVVFQIRDWERVHHQMKLYAGGVLLRHDDADRLDLALGQLEHEFRAENPEIIRLSATTAFIALGGEHSLDRYIEQTRAFDIDYLGDIPPCLHFVAPLVVKVEPLQCDLITQYELPRIATVIETEGNDHIIHYRLDVDAIRQRWPHNPLAAVTEFLSVRSVGGLPTGQIIKLQAELETPVRAEVLKDVTMIAMASREDADRVSKIQECQSLIARRIGDRVFVVKEGKSQLLEETLVEYGIVIDAI